jgi:hypothetical protein
MKALWLRRPVCLHRSQKRQLMVAQKVLRTVNKRMHVEAKKNGKKS